MPLRVLSSYIHEGVLTFFCDVHHIVYCYAVYMPMPPVLILAVAAVITLGVIGLVLWLPFHIVMTIWAKRQHARQRAMYNADL